MAIDLGTTNIKIAIYNERMKQISSVSETVEYFKEGDIVEFDAEAYFYIVKTLMEKCCRLGFGETAGDIAQIVLTGQAESLVMLGENGKPLRNGISWMDMRSRSECAELAGEFGVKCYNITGEPEIIPTWPITKILWMRKSEPEVFRKVSKYIVIKDYIYYRLTGILTGEYSVYSLTHYFDICRKSYWDTILDYCGVQKTQLPNLVEPCTCCGRLDRDISADLNLLTAPKVNIGTMDHFAGMIGTGNIKPGVISIGIGTVVSIATMLSGPKFSGCKIPLLYGPLKDSYVYLPICESGGISLEWYRNCFIRDKSFEEIDQEIMKKEPDDNLIFLPYLMGVTPPEFDPNVSGVFYGLRESHDRYDCAKAVMEGVALILKKNIDYISDVISPEVIILTGGGSKSRLWAKMIADSTGLKIKVPEISDAPTAGAAMIGFISEGVYPDYDAAISACVNFKDTISPGKDFERLQNKYKLFEKVYGCLRPLFT